jgi:hypothetical protein
VVWRFWSDPIRSQRLLTTATTTGWFLVRWLAVAYAIESLMIAWLPVGAVGTWLGAGAGPLAVPIAVAIGIPIYLNSFAAIPFVSGLIGLGMSPATGMAFMLATSATGFPAIVAVWALVKPRAFALYLGFAIVGAVIAGYACCRSGPLTSATGRSSDAASSDWRLPMRKNPFRNHRASESRLCVPLHRLPAHHEQRALLSLGIALPETAFRLTSGAPRAIQRIPESGRLNTRLICPDCVCWVYTQPRVGMVHVRAGSLDDTSWLRPTRHIWTPSKQPWVTFAEGDELFEGQPTD